MKILACGLLSAMLLAGTAAALESISQSIATSCWPVQRRRWNQSASPLPPIELTARGEIPSSGACCVGIGLP